MGIMGISGRDFRGFVKGYVGAEVGKMEEKSRVAAEQKKFQDELYANEASYIRKQNNEPFEFGKDVIFYDHAENKYY